MLDLTNKTPIAVVGLGYVGLPLAIELSKKYPTIGYDLNESRVSKLIAGKDETLEVSKKELNNSSLKISSKITDISNCEIFIITVPTPVNKNKNPDFYPLESATESVAQFINKNNIVIYESTVYPGATEEKCVPILEEKSGLKYNHDFFCGYSPERINPGDKKRTFKNITKVVSGSNDQCANIVNKLYQSIIPAGTHKVSSIAIAEAAKVIENVQRDVNIALINELSMIFNKLDLDTEEVLKAAGTKWNFLPFRPGLVGGHCIGVDPYYLTHRAAEIGYHPNIILAGRKINDGMSKYISEKAIIEMTKIGKNPVGSNIAVLGITFKENCPDIRNTKVVDIIQNLKKYDCNIFTTDPYANENECKEKYNIDLINFEKLQNIDVAILAVAHEKYLNINTSKWMALYKNDGILIDIKSVYKSGYFANTKIKHWRL